MEPMDWDEGACGMSSPLKGVQTVRVAPKVNDHREVK